MSKEKKSPATGMDLPEVASDPLDDFIAEVLLRKNMAALDKWNDIELEQLGDDGLAQLSKEDKEALNSLGSSEEFIERMIAASGRSCGQLELPTARDSGETIPEPGSTFYVGTPTEKFTPVGDHEDTAVKQAPILFEIGYRRTTELGRGGQGVVYLVQGEDEFSATNALKIFTPQAYDNENSFVADMERMKPIASLIHHDPHDDLVDIGWFGEHAGSYALLMQYINGFDLQYLTQPYLKENLQQCVDGGRWATINNVVYSANGSQQLALQPAIAVYIIERVLRGLEALHGRGIVHGDIKPSNIMLNASGSMKIIDIGSAFQIDSPPEEHYVTPAYSAPEFLENGTMTLQSDLASVGYVLIELLSGKSISDGVRDPDESTRTIGRSRREELLEAKKSLPQRLTDVLPGNILASNRLVEFCQCLIASDLNKRFPTATDAIVDCRGTYQFSKDLILSNLGVCNFQEVTQWLRDVKRTTEAATGDHSPPP